MEKSAIFHWLISVFCPKSGYYREFWVPKKGIYFSVSEKIPMLVMFFFWGGHFGGKCGGGGGIFVESAGGGRHFDFGRTFCFFPNLQTSKGLGKLEIWKIKDLFFPNWKI